MLRVGRGALWRGRAIFWRGIPDPAVERAKHPFATTFRQIDRRLSRRRDGAYAGWGVARINRSRSSWGNRMGWAPRRRQNDRVAGNAGANGVRRNYDRMPWLLRWQHNRVTWDPWRNRVRRDHDGMGGRAATGWHPGMFRAPARRWHPGMSRRTGASGWQDNRMSWGAPCSRWPVGEWDDEC
jgi:hypothetical protein